MRKRDLGLVLDTPLVKASSYYGCLLLASRGES